jgi:serine/threonine-protein kinase
MVLATATRLGPYEILAPLGAGGMGEVYRARDTRLEGTVAIKILPPQFSSDPIRKQRFEREAKVISSLNHPHICTLHDVGQQDGVDFLVMECVEGETLSKRLEKGPLPLEQVLKLGPQIADALDKAHRSGIVHRDLKPGNIMLTSTGAKLLDFGLAKPVSLLASPATLSAAKQESPVTEQGTVVGTTQYMSPEQIEGKELDGRSDIFSLGAVLYEMLTGQRAFQGKSQLSVASAILDREPEPISRLKPMTPPGLDHAIRRSLAKDPDERWQSARDLALELKWIAESGSPAGVAAPSSRLIELRERLAWATAAALAVIALIAGIAWWRAARLNRAALPIQLSAELPQDTFVDRFRGAQLAISADGARIVASESKSASEWRLGVRSLDQSQFTPLPGTEHSAAPFFSPDGQWVGFFADGKLKKIAVQGGEPVTLCDAPGYARGASWGDDGNIVAAFSQGIPGLVRVPSGGGTPTPLTKPSKQKGETAHGWPQTLPGSQAVLFTVYGATDADTQIDVLSLKTGEWKTLQEGGSFGRYVPSGHLLYMVQNTLLAAPFDLSRLALTGEPQHVVEEVNSNVLGGGDFDVSQTGALLYASSKAAISFPLSIWWLDSAGQARPLQTSRGIYENPRFSPDGKHLAFDLATGPGQADIWVKDLERDTTSRLTHLPGRNTFPQWTPDGKGIVFESIRQAASGVYWVLANGVGEAQRLIESQTPIGPSSFSPDGKRLAYVQVSVDGYPQIWTASFEGGHDHPQLGAGEPFLRTSFHHVHPAFSPHGLWMAYSSDESGTYELYVRPVQGPGGKWQISTNGGDYPIWSRSGRKLFFLTPDWHVMVVDYTASGNSFLAGKPQLWCPRSLRFLGGNYPYDLAPDGKRFAVILDASEATGQEQRSTDSLIVVLNFFDELRRRMPPGKNSPG